MVLSRPVHLSLLLLALVATGSTAFQLQARAFSPRQQTTALFFQHDECVEQRQWFEQPTVEKAIECAENIGQCSLEHLDDLTNGT